VDVFFLITPDTLQSPLDRLRGWLQTENAVTKTVLILVLGVMTLGK